MCDIRYYPFYRIRRVANIQVPYFENSVGEIIILVQVLMSMREMLKKSIEIIKSYLIRLKDIVIIEEEDNDEDDDDDDDNDNDDVMEASGYEVFREEARSSRIARKEDDDEERAEQRRRMKKLKNKRT